MEDMENSISVLEHPSGALCLITQTIDEAGRYERTETYYLPEGIRFEDVVVPSDHPNTVQTSEPMWPGMTRSTFTAMVDAAVKNVTGQTGSSDVIRG